MTAMKHATVADLIDYLQQLNPTLRVAASADDVDDAGDYVAIDFAIAEIEARKA